MKRRRPPPSTGEDTACYLTVFLSRTVLSNTRLMVQIQRLPMKACGNRQ